MDVYQEMLSELRPQAEREEIFGLDSQINEIETDLYKPLITKRGKPLHTLSVGPPGVGKSLAGDYFISNREVLTVPISVGEANSFEQSFLPRFNRIRQSFGFPFVLLVDDIEDLFEGALHGGLDERVANNQKRSHILGLLDRMQNTHGIYILATLNHPYVTETAFWRRFNIVYFPLPDKKQRKHLCSQIIPQGPLSEEAYQEILNSLTKQTAGFSFDGITNIPVFFKNRDEALTEESYQEVIDDALRKAKQQTNLQELKFLDDAAREITNNVRVRGEYIPFRGRSQS